MASLTKAIVKSIHKAIDKVYDRAIGRFLARPPVDKKIWIGVTKPRVSLPGLFQAASAEERAVADKNVLERLLDIAESYVEAQRHSTKAKVVKAVEDWLGQAHTLGVKTDLETVLGGQLVDVWNQATNGMHKIVATESTNARNVGSLDGIIKVNAASGVDDPIVYFVVVRDDSLCKECKRLHLMPDGSPRLWYLSEVKKGYHQKTDDVPSLGGLHVFCRCSIVTLTSGFGFDKKGSITYIKPDHDEMARQRGLDKSETLTKAEVASRDVIAHFRDKLGFTAKAQGANHELYYHPEAPHIKLIVQRGGHGGTMDNNMLKRVGVQTGTKFKQGKGFVPDPTSVHAAEYRRRGLLV